MKYYFCEEIPFKNTIITEYDSIEELEEQQGYFISKNTKWYIIKGDKIN